MSDARRARALFLVLLALTAFQFVILIADRRLPLGHETGSLYRLQLSFASGREAQSGWAWFEQGTLLQNALLLVAPSLQEGSFLPFFHLGMFLEELLLLLGVWLLGSKLFRSPQARFVVAAAALGSCLWIDHAAVNLLAFSALPLVLYLLHEFLEAKSRGALFLAAMLTVLQTMGRPPAFALLVPAAAALYWIGRAVLEGYPLRERLRSAGWSGKDAVVLGAPALVAVLILATAFERSSSRDGLTAGSLLAMAGLRNPLEYLDALLGLSPSLEATVFCGYFTLAFAILALIQAGLKKAFRLAGVVAGGLLALALLALLTAALLPIPFPSRTPTPGVALVRLVVIFLAGVGFERIRPDPTAARPAARVLLLGAGAIALLTLLASMAVDVVSPTVRMLTIGLPPKAVSPLVSQPVLFQELAGMSALMSGVAGGLLLLWSSGGRRAPLALALILFLHPLDVFGWKFRTTWMKSAPTLEAPPAPRSRDYGDVAWHERAPRKSEPVRTPGATIVGLLSLGWLGGFLAWGARRAFDARKAVPPVS